jgi:arginyl-tRNA synthetase
VTAAVKELLARALDEAVRDAGVEDPPDLELGRARNPAHGDYASPAGLKLARVLRRPPPQIAAELAERIEVPEGAASAEAVAGYVNFRLSASWLQRLVREVAAAGPAYGASTMGGGERVQVEFVSTNPTGPLHIGHGRGAILGDTLAGVLAFTGHRVQREYYINDFGTQARRFGQSIRARLLGREPPEGGYPGDYVVELAEKARREVPGLLEMPEEQQLVALGLFGSDEIIEQFKGTLRRLHVEYDTWYSEKSLWDQGLPQAAIARLRELGYLVEREGALWFAPAMEEDGEQAGEEEEERVVIRSDGQHTYFASDLGYLLSRFEQRGFDRVIEVWGADHHGYIPRMKQAMAALGLDPGRIEMILNQMVALKEGKMSKRQGRFVALDELIDRVGADAVRYFYLLRSPEAMMEFDLELATRHERENPVYYAQYAYARLANVEAHASERELPAGADTELLKEEWELDVARGVAAWPEAVEEAARLREPHRLPYYVQELADRVHRFYDAGNRDGRYRVIVEDAALTRARLELCRAARNTLKSALDLMAVSTPERM